MYFKQLGRFASLNLNIYNAVDHAPVDFDHAAHAGGLTTCTHANHDDPPTLIMLIYLPRVFIS